MTNSEYEYIIVESYLPRNTSGLHGPVHLRPIKGQEPFLDTYHVTSNPVLKEDYPVGTKFRVRGKISQLGNGAKYVYSNPKWEFEVL
jgi:hypothetical protein